MSRLAGIPQSKTKPWEEYTDSAKTKKLRRFVFLFATRSKRYFFLHAVLHFSVLTVAQHVMNVQQSKKDLAQVILAPHDGGLGDTTLDKLQVCYLTPLGWYLADCLVETTILVIV